MTLPVDPEFSYSVSRSAKFESCRRAYWLTYVGSWGGWATGRNPHPRYTAASAQAYLLKHLQGRKGWIGNLLHALIAESLTTRLTVGHAVEQLDARMRAGYGESVRGDYRHDPKRRTGLVEHHYDEPIPRPEWKQLRADAETMLRRFFAGPWLGYEAVYVETPDRAPDTFDFEGAPVWGMPDFVWRRDDGLLVLTDWKTGRARPDAERLQLLVYAAASIVKGRALAAEELGMQAVHLASDGPSEVLRVTQAAIDEALAAVRTHIAAMRAVWPDEGAHPPSPGALCGFCAFREMCPEGAAAVSGEAKAA